MLPVACCRQGLRPVIFRFVVPEPDGRWLAPRPGVVRKI